MVKVKFSVILDIDDGLTDVEKERAIEAKRLYLEEDIKVRLHNPKLVVKAKRK